MSGSRPADRKAWEQELFDAIATRILSREDISDQVFDDLARRLFAYQFTHNPPYRRFCQGRGITRESVASFIDIPAAPASAFKKFALTCAPVEDCVPESGGRTFHSSGTTQAETSRHHMNAAALQLYRVSLRSGYHRFIPRTAGITPLAPPLAEAPHSSLSFMLDDLGASPFSRDGQLEYDKLAMWLRVQRKDYTVFGTAFAFVNFFDSTDEDFALPEGSIVIETGGLKGRSREVERDELYAMFTQRLGVPPERCVSEYGMSEMASQFYDSTMADHVNGIVRKPRKVGPPWLKTRVVDPVTGHEAAPGQPGLLAHYDLANLNSVLAIQTEDYGVAEEGGGFTLLGRAPGAILRGCSLLAEE